MYSSHYVDRLLKSTPFYFYSLASYVVGPLIVVLSGYALIILSAYVYKNHKYPLCLKSLSSLTEIAKEPQLTKNHSPATMRDLVGYGYVEVVYIPENIRDKNSQAYFRITSAGIKHLALNQEKSN